MNKKILALVALLTFATPAFSAATIITAAVIGGALYAGAGIVTAVAIGMLASAVISKAFKIPTGYDAAGISPDLGNRQQVPPATDNKLPVVYGEAYVGGIVTDLSITSNNQQIFYVISLCEVTNNGLDTITFGDVYFGGKKCIFDPTNQYKVTGLLDESTGLTDTKINGYIEIYLYENGSNTPVNSSINAISLMQSAGLVYTWDSSKLMTNCAFAIVKLKYNQENGVTGIQQSNHQQNFLNLLL